MAWEEAAREARVGEARVVEARVVEERDTEAQARKTAEAMAKRLDAAFVANATMDPMPPGRNERLFWLPLLRCDPFGADAPKSGYNRRYQAWLGEALLQPDDDGAGEAPASTSVPATRGEA